MTNLEKALKNIFKDKYDEIMKSTLDISKAIAFVAHKSQSRLNKEPYFNHPVNMVNKYAELLQFSNEDFMVDNVVIHGIPFFGVMEVCYLHDVIEDTDYTFEEIKAVFEKHGYLNEFNEDLATPLVLITHNKSEPYDVYVNECCQNIVSALVKFLDMVDNLNLFTLDKFESEELERIIKYNNCLKIINDKFHFIEKFNNYEMMMKYLAYERQKREKTKQNK